jgi:uncharacterized metal-binding protein
MPNGHTHDAVTWFLVTPMAYGAWSVAHNGLGAAISATAFAFAGLMFSGDLDLPSSQYRRWGKLRWIWKPYQWVVPHRSVVSHGILLGPAGRLLYLALVGVAAGAGVIRLVTGTWSIPWAQLNLASGVARGLDAHTWIFVAYALWGLWLGGASHSLADWGWSAFKRGLR